MIQHLHCQVDVCRMTRDDHQSLAFAACRKGCAIYTSPDSPRFHDLDLARTHVPNLVDLRTSFTNNAPNKIVRDIDLLSLELLWRILASTSAPTVLGGGIPWNIRRTLVGRSARNT